MENIKKLERIVKNEDLQQSDIWQETIDILEFIFNWDYAGKEDDLECLELHLEVKDNWTLFTLEKILGTAKRGDFYFMPAMKTRFNIDYYPLCEEANYKPMK